MERLSMRKVREVLRLRFDLGLSERQIAKSAQASRSTIAEYLRRFAESGIVWPLPSDLADVTLEARLFPPRPALPNVLRPVPDWPRVHHEMHKKGVTLYLLWQEHKADHPEGFRYSWFCHHYREWAGKLDTVMRQEHLAGEKCFVDYAGQTMPVTDRHTGEIRQAQIFVGVMGASNYTFAEATWSQNLADWIGSHVRMLDYFGAAPQMLVPDNLKSGVTRACRYEPDLNPSYLEFANHYGIAVMPARVRKPRDKAKVEGGVLIVERWILACLRNRTFFSLAELNTAISELLTRLNLRPFKKLPGCRQAVFRKLDYPAMQPLPANPYYFAEWKKARVNVDYHIEVESRLYSVPYALIGKQVDVRYTQGTIEILYRGERIASHARLQGGGSRYSTQTGHMPDKHRGMAEWTPERIQRWAASIGPQTAQLVGALMAQRRHPQQAFRSAMGIIRMGKLYGNERLEAACRRACVMNAVSYTSVESILKKRLDEVPLPADVQHTLPIAHANLRGAEYYH